MIGARSHRKWWRIVAVLMGAGVLAVIGIRHYPASPARVPAAGRVLEIRPEIDGPVIAIAAEPNSLVRKGAVLLQIDPAPYAAKLQELEAALADAHQKIAGLKSELAAADAAVEAIQAQHDDIVQELGQLERHPGLGTGTEFRLLYVLDEQALLSAQLRMAKAQAAKSRQAFDAQIGTANLAAARFAVQVADAQSALDHATIRAPADGYVDKINVAVGGRAVTRRSAVSFIPADAINDRERFLSGSNSSGSTPARAFRRGQKGHNTFAGKIRALLR